MVFYPDTYIRLLTGVPLDNKYTDTITFQTQQNQINYFLSKVLYTYDKCSYQRADPAIGQLAKIRVPVVAEKIYNVNYVMFRNNNFGTKWFYAFVTRVDYINDNMSQLSFEIDILQTWMFDYTVHPSFVIREHTNNDAIGANVMPENVSIGDHVYGEFLRSGEMYPYQAKICVAASFDKNLSPAQAGLHGFVYNGIALNIFDTAEEVNSFIDQATGDTKADGILSIFMVPSFITDNMSDEEELGVEHTPKKRAFVDIQIDKEFGSFDGYTPRNNKLYTYPYNFLTVISGPSNIVEMHYEYFDSTTCGFSLYGELSLNPQMILIPRHYRITDNNQDYRNMIMSLPLSGFPQCSYICDTYKMIMASQVNQYQTKQLVNATGGFFGTIANLVTGNIGGALNAAGGAISDAMMTEAKLQDQARLPPTAHTMEADVTAYSLGYMDYRFANTKIRGEFAKSIDDYFTMYGYATNRLKQPNIFGRRNWNYVRTSGAVITGSMPADDLAKIIDIFNRGVTFWHTTDVGNYNLPNPIVGGG